MSVPIYINCRDRVSDLLKLISWLEHAGHQRIILLDNNSTYPGLLEYYEQTPHRVILLQRNLGCRALWRMGEPVPREPFVYTDPDIVPLPECPPQAIEVLQEALDRHPDVPKAGLGLYLRDLPPKWWNLAHEEDMMAPEREVEPQTFRSLIDTSFALYRPGSQFHYDALRLGFPYQARHTSWYMTDLDDENRYYLARADTGRDGSSWAQRVAA